MVITSMLVERMLENRGYTEEFMSDLESYVPNEQLLNSGEICERLKAIHDEGREITFLPDFDMDGIMSGVIGFAGLAELGFHVNLFVPDPKEGYGFNRDTIVRLIHDYPNTSAIMSGDVGITCFEGVKTARAFGLEFLLTDHHTPDRNKKTGAERLPAADVVVDPMQEADPFSDPRICGANVVYRVLQTYANTYCSRQVQEQIRRLRVFAGIGTISDAMPLVHANRQLVRDAVSIARMIYSNGTDFAVRYIDGSETYKRAFRGLYQVLSLWAEAGKIKDSSGIDEMLFAFYVSPMFNAAKRMDADMARVFGVFFGANGEDDAKYLYNLNERRKVAVSDYFAKISERSQPHAPYIYFSDAPEGILGLLATRLLDKKTGPCLVLREKENGGFKGSGRSPEWYPFLKRTERTRSVSAAGHQGSFGVGLRDEKDVEDTVAFLRADVAGVRDSVDLSVYEPKADFVIADDGSGDTIIDIVLFLEFLAQLDEMRPFGVGFPEPTLLLRFRPTEGEWSTMGSMKQHLKVVLPHGFEVLCWNQSDKMSLARSNKPVEVWGRLGINRFRDSVTVQFMGEMK